MDQFIDDWQAKGRAPTPEDNAAFHAIRDRCTDRSFVLFAGGPRDPNAVRQNTIHSNPQLDDIVDGLIRENADVQTAVKAICARGSNWNFARAEIGRAFMACVCEVGRKFITNGEHRFKDVLRLLANGRTTFDLWLTAEELASLKRTK